MRSMFLVQSPGCLLPFLTVSQKGNEIDQEVGHSLHGSLCQNKRQMLKSPLSKIYFCIQATDVCLSFKNESM